MAFPTTPTPKKKVSFYLRLQRWKLGAIHSVSCFLCSVWFQLGFCFEPSTRKPSRYKVSLRYPLINCLTLVLDFFFFLTRCHGLQVHTPMISIFRLLGGLGAESTTLRLRKGKEG